MDRTTFGFSFFFFSSSSYTGYGFLPSWISGWRRDFSAKLVSPPPHEAEISCSGQPGR